MLRTLSPLNRVSGGVIPTGAIITYQITTIPKTKKIGITYQVYYDTDAFVSNKPEVPIKDIVEFKKGENQVRGGEMEINDSMLNDVNPITFVNITDSIAKAFLEINFPGLFTLEILGDTL